MIMDGAQNDDDEQGEWNNLVRVFDELENVLETTRSSVPGAASNPINFDLPGRYMDALQEPHQRFPTSSTLAQLPASLQPDGSAFNVTRPFSRQPQYESSYRTHTSQRAAHLQPFEMISHLPLSIGHIDRSSLVTSVPLAHFPDFHIQDAPTLEQQLMRPYEEQKESQHQMQQWLQSLAAHDAHNASLLNRRQEPDPLPARLPPVPHSLEASSSSTSRSPSSGQPTSPPVLSDDIYAAQYPLPQHKLLKPLTAYNYFYRDERDNIVDGITTELDPFPNPVSDFSQSKLETLLHQRWYMDPIKKKRAHRKKHGKLGFEEYVKKRDCNYQTNKAISHTVHKFLMTASPKPLQYDGTIYQQKEKSFIDWWQD
jgi:hypothetical protein